MARKTDKGFFIPKNPEKYIGNNIDKIQYRSSWELSMMLFLDGPHPSIIGWASEAFTIPYKNPLTGKWTVYVPDFLILYLDKNNKQHCEVFEIKPESETPGAKVRKLNEYARLTQSLNAAKWQAATIFCAKRGWTFRVATEKQLFAYGRRK